MLIVVVVYSLLTTVRIEGWGWAGDAAVWAAVAVLAAEAACLPLELWRGLLRERRFGLSTQSARGWLADRAKGDAIGIALAAAAWVGAVGLARTWPSWWPLPAAAAFALVGLELAGMPFLAWTSRRWQRAADRCSLELTGDREAFAGAHVALARKNLSDLDPPRLAYLMLFSHPTPPERLELARAR